MDNNDILRRVRYALNIRDKALVEIFQAAGIEMDSSRLAGLLQKEETDGFIPCGLNEIEGFLNGLITRLRGAKEQDPSSPKARAAGNTRPAAPPAQRGQISNNDVLKKLRIALNYREDDMLDLFALGGMKISKAEMSALFRKKGQRNYKNCGDQLLRNFLRGLTVKMRKPDSPGQVAESPVGDSI